MEAAARRRVCVIMAPSVTMSAGSVCVRQAGLDRGVSKLVKMVSMEQSVSSNVSVETEGPATTSQAAAYVLKVGWD